MSVKATVEAARQDDVATLLRQSDLVAELLYPGEFRRPITADYLAKPGTHVLVARLVGEAVGMCVVFDRGDATIEVKRMIVDHNARGRGAGSCLLDAAHFHGMALGARLALLEVGTRNVEDQALYRKAGYMFRGPFAPYNASLPNQSFHGTGYLGLGLPNSDKPVIPWFTFGRTAPDPTRSQTTGNASSKS